VDKDSSSTLVKKLNDNSTIHTVTKTSGGTTTTKETRESPNAKKMARNLNEKIKDDWLPGEDLEVFDDLFS